MEFNCQLIGTIYPSPSKKTFNVIITRPTGERAVLAPKYRSHAAACAALKLYRSGTYISLRN